MIGKKIWAIAEGYIPSGSTGPSEMLSHETLCILNANDSVAHISLLLYFADQMPVGPYSFAVAAQRTHHMRFNDLQSPQPVPRDTDYACVLTSDQPVIVQHTRLDSRQSENAIFSTIAYAA